MFHFLKISWMKKIKAPDSEIEIRYANWIKMIIDIVKPKNLAFIGGRGTAKSTDIIAERAIDICFDMPRAPFAFFSDTYVNLMTNIVPAVLQGWERKKWFEFNPRNGYGHYVVDCQPPAAWPSPFIKTFDYKHSISTFLGNKFFLLSLDRASINAGLSVVHHFGDEVKYSREDRVSKLFPTLRGDALLYGHSHFFMGQTFCTDMPNPQQGEHDWILRLEKNMNRRQIVQIIQTALIVNDLNIDLINARQAGANPRSIAAIQSNLKRWLARLRKVRQNSTFFYVVSSFANADILTLEYFKNLFESLDFEEFKSSVLSIKAKLELNARFYGNLRPVHFYFDSYNYDYYDQFGLMDNISQNSLGLKHILHSQPLEAGFDAGNMMSLAIGQPSPPNVYRVLKAFHTLSPLWIRDLADLFLSFFLHHRHKVLHLYYDRSANQYARAKRDFASKLKHDIEHTRDGKPSGWHVILMSVGQANISHAQEFDFMNELMSNRNRALPSLLIDAHECRNLKSSLELAPLIKDGRGNIRKDKSSERLAPHRLPSESTNFSDAFKYLLCRKHWLKLVQHRRTPSQVGDVRVRG